MKSSYKFYHYTESDLALIPERPARSHKGTFGRLLVIGGCAGMCGAPFFAALAAYRSGVGLVEIFSVEENRLALHMLIPEAIITPYSSDAPYEASLRSAILRADAIAIGMGLGRAPAAVGLLSIVLRASCVPLVVDADALNLIAQDGELFRLMCERRNNAVETIVTPHFGEMSRLCSVSVSDIENNTALVAKDFSNRTGAICLLKDHNTVVCEPSCDDVFVNTSGCSGLATAGSGDVLAGVIGAMCAYGVPSAEAARLGAYVHGLAGEAAAKRLSEYSVTARDIIEALPDIFLRVESIKAQKDTV